MPIGNDADITQRVVGCLAKVPVIFCEDTRVTMGLLRRYGILNQQQLMRMDQHQEYRSMSQLDDALRSGDAAFVSDAGSPGLSDPGALLIEHAHQTGVQVSVLPGASALTAFIAIAGVQLTSFYFGGFLPKKTTDINQCMQWCHQHQLLGIWFESPRRICRLVATVADLFPTVPVVFAKELTKPYERVYRGSITNVKEQMSSENTNGEWVVMVDFRQMIAEESIDYHRIASELKQAQLTHKQVKQMARLLHCSKNKLYQAFQAL